MPCEDGGFRACEGVGVSGDEFGSKQLGRTSQQLGYFVRRGYLVKE